jgi:hypothetical protein
MSLGKLGLISVVFMILFSLAWMSSSHGEMAAIENLVQLEILSEEVNIIDNAGYESGSFNPWVNQGGTSYNQIQTGRVYSGDYALYMESHFSTAPYEPVYQNLDSTVGIDQARYFSAAVYPTMVGNTAGQAGVDQISFSINNTVTGTMHYMFYEWSGYTYPGGDIGVNVTSKVLFLLFDLVPNHWNIIERDLLSDYTAFFGAPADASQLVITRIDLIAHVSNGDPGDFWIDELSINHILSPTTTTEAPTTNIETSTTPPPTTSQETGNPITALITVGSSAVIVIAVIVIFLSRNESTRAAPVSEYNW